MAATEPGHGPARPALDDEAVTSHGAHTPDPYATIADDEDVVALWRRFREHGDEPARERLILQYAPLVKYVAARLAVGLPSSVERGDLVSYGLLGLIDALERFDVTRQVKFETYALSRVRGAVLDELRSLDWVPRSVRAKARRVEDAMARLEHELGRTPEDHELAAELGMGLADLHRVLADVSLTSVVALDEALTGAEGESGTWHDQVPDRATPGPERQLVDAELRRVLVATVEELGERERRVVVLYYFEGMTLAQIGEILGVTESRVSQIHSRAVLALRAKVVRRVRG